MKEIQNKPGRRPFPLAHARSVLEAIVAGELTYQEIADSQEPKCSLQHVCSIRKRVNAIKNWRKVTASKETILKHVNESAEFVDMVFEVLELDAPEVPE